MSYHWTDKDIKDAHEKIAKRAARDPAFRELALKDAAKAIQQAIGHEIPSDFKVRFIDGSDADMTIVLPQPVDSRALGDSDLEQVAGGGRCGGSCVGISSII